LRKVFLENLPHRGDLICWNKSLGYTIPFKFEDVSGNMKIVDINNDKKSVVLEYLGKEYSITTYRLMHGGLSKILGANYGERKSKYCIGDIINNKKIINIFYKNGRKKYTFQCLKCEQNNIQSEYNLEHCGCPICNQSRIIVPHINGIKGLYPEVYNMITDEDKDLYASKSDHKVHWNCPYCNGKNYTAIHHLTEADDKKTRYPCIYCRKSFSMGESMLYGVLAQIAPEFEHHVKFEWSDGKEYDAHINGIIIEAHGKQHYEECTGVMSDSLLEQQKNDRYKLFLAEKYYQKLKAYIVIDCRISDFEYIKKNIMSSGLDELLNFNFDVIDWEYIASSIKEGLYFKVGELYKNGISVIQIAKRLNINKSTVYNCLHSCEELGIINFIYYRNAGWHVRKKVRCKNTGDIFDSAIKAAKWCGLKSSTSISSCCNNAPKFKTAGKHPITKERLEWEFA
jgi:hypothetical protein